MKGFNPNWSNYMTYKPSKFQLKGILHLKHVGNKFNKFLTAINCGLPVPTLDPCKIVDAILDQRQWEPLISPAFELRYNLQHFAQLPQTNPNLPPSPVAGASGARGRAMPHPTPPITLPIIPAGGGLPAPIAPGRGRGMRLENTSFNKALFGVYNNSSIKSKILCDKITQGLLQPLPSSKVNNSQAICLDWHTKAHCNSNCPCACDHVHYNANKYTDIATWCVIGYAHPATQS